MIEKAYEKIMLLRYAHHLRFFRQERKILCMLNVIQINEDYYVAAVDSFVSAVLCVQGRVLILRPSDYSVLAVLDYSEIYRSSSDFIVRPLDSSAVFVLALFPY
jgi:hypothetical protein